MPRFAPLFASIGVCLALAAGCTNKQPDAQKTDEKTPAATPGNETAPKADGALPDLPDPVATVNDVPIALSQFKEIYDLKVKKYSDRGREIPPSADRRYRKSITERLIYNEVLRQEAKARGVEVDQTKLAEREVQQKQGIKDWDKHLQRRGETEQSLREMYVAEILEQQILDKDGKLAVTDKEVDEEYEKIKPNYKSDQERIQAAHILIPVGPQQPPGAMGEKPPEPSAEEKEKWRKEALAKAEEIHKKATAPGADFSALAKENSVGPSADKGGDLGIFTKDRMVEEFSVAAFKLKPGEISKPVETKFGIHVIKVLAKYPPGDLPKDALVDQIRERLSQRKLHQGRRELKEALLAKYKVKNTMEEVLGPDPRGPKRPAVVNPSGGNLPAGHPPIDMKAEPGKPAEDKAGEPDDAD